MTDKAGFLAIAVFQHRDGSQSDLTVAFEATEEKALEVGQRELDEQGFDDPVSFKAIECREISYNDRWWYRDDDVVYADRRIGAWVKPTATPKE